MSSRNMILMVLALLIVGGTAYFVMQNVNQAPPEAVVVEEEELAIMRILVAKKPISQGSFVRGADDLEWKEWPEDKLLDAHIQDGNVELASFNGSVARRAIQVGEPITSDIVISRGSGGFLSAVLEPGKRAVSIAVSPTSGAAGFIFPGDRVDLIVTHRIMVQESGASGVAENIVSETFLHDVRVVAVDQILDTPEQKTILAKTVTVEVTPDAAEKISVAQDLGKISLVLRSMSDNSAIATEAVREDKEEDYLTTITVPASDNTITRGGDVSKVLKSGNRYAPRMTVIRGDTTTIQEFVGGSQ